MYYVLIYDYHLKITLGNQHVNCTEDTDQHGCFVYVFKFKVSILTAFMFQKYNNIYIYLRRQYGSDSSVMGYHICSRR